MSEDFDFDLGADDEAAMLAVEATSGKRSHSPSGTAASSSKRTKTDGDSARTQSPNMLLANRILNERFELKSFRLEQEAAITRVLDGGSAVVVFPTGGGKSLCYQVIWLRAYAHDVVDLLRLLPCAFGTRMRRRGEVYHSATALPSSSRRSSL